MSEAHEKPRLLTRTSSAYGARPTYKTHEVRKRVTWWDQPKLYMVGPKTESYMTDTTTTKSSMAKPTTYMTSRTYAKEIQQQGSKPCNYTVMSSRNGIRDILNRFSFLV